MSFFDWAPTPSWLNLLSVIAVLVYVTAAVVVNARSSDEDTAVKAFLTNTSLKYIGLGGAAVLLANAIAIGSYEIADDGSYRVFWYPFAGGIGYAPVAMFKALSGPTDKAQTAVSTQFTFAAEAAATQGGYGISYPVTLWWKGSDGWVPATLTVDFPSGMYSFQLLNATVPGFSTTMIKKAKYDAKNMSYIVTFVDGSRPKMVISFTERTSRLINRRSKDAPTRWSNFVVRSQASPAISK